MLALFAAVLAVSLLLVGLIALTWTLLKALVTGQKPAPAVLFSRFQSFSTQAGWPGAVGGRRTAATEPRGEVVDVEVREVANDRKPG
ncbi:MAG: hypothetical protein JWQ72_1462 [Polaromonas sp.]|nr:hypothetical protein [Polaromonas sp.]